MATRTYIIAEAGVNHNGSLETAKALVDAAAQAGADAVKFQTFTADKLVTQTAEKAAYQQKAGAPSESQLTMLRKLELSHDAHVELIRHSEKRSIQFLTTAFDSDSADFVRSLSLPFVKVPSGEITNLPYLKAITRFGCPVILSTGMATLGEGEVALGIIGSQGITREDITILHCHTDYPTRFKDANLRAMQTMAVAFPGVKVGFSDHTLGIEASIAAIAMGACLIEKHFTLDRTLPGPDHAASLEPAELTAMVKAIRNIELALGHGRKEPTANELKIRRVARKSIVASRPIECGEIFSITNLCAKRPGTGISPMHWDELVGKPAKRTYAADELIEPQ